MSKNMIMKNQTIKLTIGNSGITKILITDLAIGS